MTNQYDERVPVNVAVERLADDVGAVRAGAQQGKLSIVTLSELRSGSSALATRIAGRLTRARCASPAGDESAEVDARRSQMCDALMAVEASLNEACRCLGASAAYASAADTIEPLEDAEVHACVAAWALEEAIEHAGEMDAWLLREPEQPGDHEALARDVMRMLRQADSPWQLAASVTRACALVVRRSGSEGPDRAAVYELADGANELDYQLVVLRADINGRVSRGELAADGEAMSAIQPALVAVRAGRRSLDLARSPRLAPPLRDAALKRAHEAFKVVKRAVDDVRRGAGEERAAAQNESE